MKVIFVSCTVSINGDHKMRLSGQSLEPCQPVLIPSSSAIDDLSRPLAHDTLPVRHMDLPA